MSRLTDATIDRIAANQHGVVTRAQLLDAGVTGRQVERRLAAGRLHSLHRGVYLIGTLRGPLEPEFAPEMAAVLACGSGALASHASAARLWELGLVRGPGSPVEVMIPARVHRERRGIRVHRASGLTPSDCCVRDGIPVTTPGRTLRDLSARLGTQALSRLIARAEREGLLDDQDLAAMVVRHTGRRGAPLLRAVAGPHADRPFTRSEAERRLLGLVRSGGLPAPATNVIVLDHEVDFLWAAERLIVEVDGFRYHGSRPAFENDHRRDARLVAGGYRVLRFSWRQIVHEPRKTLVALARALAGSTGL